VNRFIAATSLVALAALLRAQESSAAAASMYKHPAHDPLPP
jgi:hypothetical protein